MHAALAHEEEQLAKRPPCVHASNAETYLQQPSPGTADKARDKRSGELVALKKLRMERERDGESLFHRVDLVAMVGLQY